MAIDIDPCRETKKLENDKFAENSNGKVIVRVEDETAIGVLQNILTELGGSAGTPFYAQAQTTTTPGALQTLINETVPASTTRSLNKVVVVCRRSAKFEIKINSTVVGSGRTGPANMNVSFVFLPVRDAAESDTITVDFEQINGGPSVDVEVYLMATDKT